MNGRNMVPFSNLLLIYQIDSQPLSALHDVHRTMEYHMASVSLLKRQGPDATVLVNDARVKRELARMWSGFFRLMGMIVGI